MHQECRVWGTALAVQWLRLCTPNAGGQGLIPGQGTRPHMLQLKSLHATTKDFTPHKEDWRPRVLQLRSGAARIKKRNVAFRNNWTSCFNSNSLSLKKKFIKAIHTIWPSNCTWAFIQRMYIHTKKLYTNVYSSFICNSQELGKNSEVLQWASH